MEIFEQYLKAERDLQYSANNYVRTLIALGRNKDAKAFIKQNKYKIIKSLKDKVKNLPATNKRINSRQHEPVIQEDEAESALVMELSLSRKAEQFSNEKILEDELTSRIESGLPVFGNHLKVYKRKGEFGRHYIYPLAVLALLCEDTNGELYIIELNKVSGYDDAYEQIVKYINCFNDCEKFKEKR
jgi:RecB family endonuclease NucS